MYLEVLNFDKACEYYSEIFQNDNKDIKSNFDLSLISLLHKEYRLGFKRYESRLLLESYRAFLPIKYPKKLQDLKNKTVFVFHEQGLGDTLQFIRFIDNLYKYTNKISIYVQNSLRTLLQESFPKYNFVSDDYKHIQYDFVIPLISIPYLLDMNIIKPINKYVFTKKINVKKFKQNIKLNKNIYNIGICWQGQSENTRDKYRSIPYEKIKSLFNISKEKIQFYSLQKDFRVQDENIIDLGLYFDDFTDTAIAIESMDLIITVDTSIVHLAGSLGKKTWLLLPYLPDWRWGLNENSTDWYKKVTIFRQKNRLDWAEVLLNIKYQLKKKVDLQNININEEIKYTLNLEEKKLYNQALSINKKLIKIDPLNYEVLYNMGNILSLQDDFLGAIKEYKKALLLKQDFIFCLNNISNCFQRLRRFDEAKYYLLQAIRINPNIPMVLDNYASLLKDMHNYQEAELFYNKAIRCDKTHISAHHNLGLLYILQGKFIQGWVEYEWRLKKEDYIKFNSRFTKNIWTGEDLTSKVLLISMEQGFGDCIQFIRYVLLIKKQFNAKKIIVTVSAPLIKLFQTITEIDTIFNLKDEIPKYDYYIPIMNLAKVFNTDITNVPTFKKYLKIDSKMNKFIKDGKKINIGFVWSGSNTHNSNLTRDIQLKLFKKIFTIKEGKFYSLQVDTKEDESKYFEKYNITDMGKSFNNFHDTASVIKYLDLVITIDTSVAHLSASLGVKTWVLLSSNPSFLWMNKGKKSLWYPSMYLFRQEVNQSWKELFVDVENKLKKFIKKKI